jgi:hypothetical protein
MNWSTRVKQVVVAIYACFRLSYFAAIFFDVVSPISQGSLGPPLLCHFVFKRSLGAVVFDGEIQHKHCSNSTSVTRRFFSDDLRTLLSQCCLLQNELRCCRIRHWRTPGKLTRTYVIAPENSPLFPYFFLGSLLSLLTRFFS